MQRSLIRILVIAWLATLAPALFADTATVAVAANFSAATEQLAREFEQKTRHRILVSAGATGQLYAKISHGAPYDVFLSADAKHPGLLLKEGNAVAGTEFIYAVGTLVLWSADPALISNSTPPAIPDLLQSPALLKSSALKKLAIANPKSAPYGAAALETLQQLELLDTLQPKLVYGESITQAFQFAASHNADAAFVALAQIMALPEAQRGSMWIVPAQHHQPIAQQAVLLKKGEHNAAAKAWLDFLRSDTARAYIRQLGYTTE